jgi:hypothetical protein
MLNKDLPPQPSIAGALHQAISDVFHDPEFIKSMAEKVADTLEGYDDKIILQALQKANDGEYASEEEVFSVLKDK